MKLLSIAIPCYNSEAYMEHCINTLLTGGDEVEIIIVDDGSQKDRTPEIADEYERRYPGICRAIHQENGGHGQAVNTGLKNATGVFFKVVDSDDFGKDDDQQRESNSISNQKAMLEEFAARQGFTNIFQSCDRIVHEFYGII